LLTQNITKKGLPPYGDSPRLLAVDCGLKTGLALFTLQGDLLWYRSHNFGSRACLKKAAWSILKEIDGLTHLVVEGGGTLADVWIREADKRGLNIIQVQAHEWRKDILLDRQQRTGKQAKQVADELAREVIDQSGAAKPTSLRHDAAEAILVGWWAVNSTNLHKTGDT
jgi:hypothetical protein